LRALNIPAGKNHHLRDRVLKVFIIQVGAERKKRQCGYFGNSEDLPGEDSGGRLRPYVSADLPVSLISLTR